MREGNVFTTVCNSVHGGGGLSASGWLGRVFASRDTPPPSQTPPVEMITEASGTHPTGMHSCLIYFQMASFDRDQGEFQDELEDHLKQVFPDDWEVRISQEEPTFEILKLIKKSDSVEEIIALGE